MIEEYINQIRNFTTIGPKVTVEIGALDGEYSGILKKTFGIAGDDIYFVEPNPDLQQSLKRNFPQATIVNKAIAAEKGSLQLNRVNSLNRSKVGSSSLLQRVDGWNKNLTYDLVLVEVITGKMLLDKICKPIDLCIIDVEGLAYEVIASFDNMLPIIKSIMVECEHTEIFKGQRLYEDISKLLTEKGYRLMAFKYSYANQSDSVWVHEKYVNLGYRDIADSESKGLGWIRGIKNLIGLKR